MAKFDFKEYFNCDVGEAFLYALLFIGFFVAPGVYLIHEYWTGVVWILKMLALFFGPMVLMWIVYIVSAILYEKMKASKKEKGTSKVKEKLQENLKRNLNEYQKEYREKPHLQKDLGLGGNSTSVPSLNQLLPKDLNFGKIESLKNEEEIRAKILAAKNVAAEKIYGNKYMSRMCR